MTLDRPESAHGLVTVEGTHLDIILRLDAAISAHARRCGAREIRFPAIQPLEDLDNIEYFTNFPHLGLAVGQLNADAIASPPLQRSAGRTTLPAAALEPAHYMLPSAACYPAYVRLKGKTLSDTQFVTTAQNCFRNETQYDELRRLRGFTMREIVVIGPADTVKTVLQTQKAWIALFSQAVGLTLSVRPATDPFFDRSGSRAVMQGLFVVKEEFVHASNVAVASVNFHRNYFAEKWGIRLADGSYAYSGCVAFGLERWLGALLDQHGADGAAALGFVTTAADAAP